VSSGRTRMQSAGSSLLRMHYAGSGQACMTATWSGTLPEAVRMDPPSPGAVQRALGRRSCLPRSAKMKLERRAERTGHGLFRNYVSPNNLARVARVARVAACRSVLRSCNGAELRGLLSLSIHGRVPLPSVFHHRKPLSTIENLNDRVEHQSCW
jgi:hypothetical protein